MPAGEKGAGQSRYDPLGEVARGGSDRFRWRAAAVNGRHELAQRPPESCFQKLTRTPTGGFGLGHWYIPARYSPFSWLAACAW